MKFISKILTTVAMLGLCASAMAQADYFAGARTVALVYPQSVNAGSSSNFCTDIHGYEGIAKIDIVTLTNGACSAATLNIYTSSDRTNWYSLSNYAVATSNSIVITNIYYPGVQLATNVYMLPGTATTPTLPGAGFATPYIATAPFTNNGAITLTTGLQTIGFSIPDSQRYIQFFYNFTGASTNTVSAVLTARKQQY